MNEVLEEVLFNPVELVEPESSQEKGLQELIKLLRISSRFPTR